MNRLTRSLLTSGLNRKVGQPLIIAPEPWVGNAFRRAPTRQGRPRKPTARGVARSMLNLLAHSLFTRGVSHLARQLRSTAHEPWNGNGHVSRRAPDRSSIVHCRRTAQGNAYWIFNRSMHALFARVLARVPCCKPSWASRVRCWLSLNAKARSCLAYARNGRIARGSNLERCWHSRRVP